MASDHIRHAPDSASPGTILVVEDDDGVRAFVRLGLEQTGYNVLAAADSTEALELFRANPARIDLVLSDVIMPNQSGPELVAELRRLRPGVRVVFMSGYTGGIDSNPAEFPGDAPLLEKPFSLERLQQVVAQSINRH
jgi:CheY-like chemotaxis protein